LSLVECRVKLIYPYALYMVSVTSYRINIYMTYTTANVVSYTMIQQHEADHSPPASAEVKKMWLCTSTPP
jgi:hypothetical protein